MYPDFRLAKFVQSVECQLQVTSVSYFWSVSCRHFTRKLKIVNLTQSFYFISVKHRHQIAGKIISVITFCSKTNIFRNKRTINSTFTDLIATIWQIKHENNWIINPTSRAWVIQWIMDQITSAFH